MTPSKTEHDLEERIAATMREHWGDSPEPVWTPEQMAGHIVADALPVLLAERKRLLDGIKHALDALNEASDKATYGDSVEGDLLEAHATLDSLLAEDDQPTPEAPASFTIERERAADHGEPT